MRRVRDLARPVGGWGAAGAPAADAAVTIFPRVVVTDDPVALLSVVLGVLVGARANDPRTAQQVGAVIVVPLVGAVIAQAAGRFLVDATGYALAALVVLLIATAGLRAGSWLFAREAILTRWR